MSKVKILLCLQFIFFSSLSVLAQVDTAWVRRYNGTANLTDVANAVAVDKSGNVYVTGYSVGDGTGSDYATIKYALNGDTLWVRRFNSSGNLSDLAEDLVVDDSGNVYVTGSSGTIKYLPSGDTAWIKTGYYGYAIEVDKYGYVYIAGSNVTIKYLPNGDTAWVRGYGGVALTFDDDGNLYVTGAPTIKYLPNGDTSWVRSYGVSGRAVAVDSNGNVYVTGISHGTGTYEDYATIKFDSTGDTLWVRGYNGPVDSIDIPMDLAVDDSGNVYVTGGSYGSGNFPDYVTIKYAPNGETLWVRRYDGPGNYDDIANALVLDNLGNVYVTGWVLDLSTEVDYATIMYTPNGNMVWVRQYDGGANNLRRDYANALTVDDSGYVYVTGESFGSGTASDYATIKYFPCLVKPGDVNASGGNPNLSDIIYLVNFIFKGGPAPSATCAGDANASGGSGDLTDIIYLVNFVFKGGPAPPEIAVCCK